MWLSYIIPCYNCEKYISKCLDSILDQGLDAEEYEVIVINDGSTDGGAEIVAGYCEAHENIRLINQDNGGVASARNRGLDEAKGDYIEFVDADDYLLPGGMRILRDEYLQPANNPDMICFWAHTVDSYYIAEEWGYIRPHKKLFQGAFLEYVKKFGLDWSVWRRIISRRLLDENKIRFKRFNVGEDVLFLSELYEIGDAVVVSVSLDIYRYVVRKESALTRYDEKHIENTAEGLMELINIFRNKRERYPLLSAKYDERIEAMQRQLFFRICSAPLPCIKRLLDKSRREDSLPIDREVGRMDKFINLSYNHPFMIYMFSMPFRYIFLPLIKPMIKRN